MVHTIVNRDIPPQVLALSYHASLASCNTCTDERRYLLRVVVLKVTWWRGEWRRDDAVDGRGEDDVCVDVAFLSIQRDREVAKGENKYLGRWRLQSQDLLVDVAPWEVGIQAFWCRCRSRSRYLHTCPVRHQRGHLKDWVYIGTVLSDEGSYLYQTWMIGGEKNGDSIATENSLCG
jgi:hypothetical protein